MEKLNRRHLCRSVRETGRLAFRLAGSLRGGEVIALFGELGSGKTTFVQALARGLGIKERVVSPTFVFNRRYPVRLKAEQEGIKWFYHLDLYRAVGAGIADELALADLWQRPEVVVAIEWADRIKDRLPRPRIEIHCLAIDENRREFAIKYR